MWGSLIMKRPEYELSYENDGEEENAPSELNIQESRQSEAIKDFGRNRYILYSQIIFHVISGINLKKKKSDDTH